MRRIKVPFQKVVLLTALLGAACGTSPTTEAETPLVTQSVSEAEGQLHTPVFTPTQPPSPEPVLPATDTPVPLPIAEDIGVPRFPIGAEVDLTFIQMITDLQGWGISGWHILRTEDGGISWRDVTPPEGRLLESDRPEEAVGAFIDAEMAWVVFLDIKSFPVMQLNVWTTGDGGSTWSVAAPVFPFGPGEFFEVFLRVHDRWHGWLLTDTIVMGTGRNDTYSLFQTSNGGRTWTEFNLNPYVVTDLEFYNPMLGWISEEMSGPYDSIAPFLRFTVDGGETWERQDLPLPPAATVLADQHRYCSTYDVDFLTDGSLITIVECSQSPFEPEGSLSYLYLSLDFGNSWDIQPLPQSIRAGGEVVVLDRENALLLGAEMYSSSDGRQSWTKFKEVNWTGQFSFVERDVGWAIAKAGEETALVRTLDGGQTWVLIKPIIAP